MIQGANVNILSDESVSKTEPRPGLKWHVGGNPTPFTGQKPYPSRRMGDIFIYCNWTLNYYIIEVPGQLIYSLKGRRLKLKGGVKIYH
jgi:hypothetical protein